MKILAIFSRIVVGMYLMFSGFLKVVDPYGTALKLKEYFEVFAMDVPVLEGLFIGLSEMSVTLSVLFCCMELVVGVALFFGFKLRYTAWVALLMMTFFTFLTFYSAYFNRVTDCGCFGEFMKLKPWHSFWKNVVTMVFILIIFFYRKKYRNMGAGTPAVLIASILSLGIGIYSLSYLPVIDMLPYAVGKSIPEQMKRPDVAPEIEYEFLDKTSGKTLKSKEYLMDTVRYTYQSSVVLNEDLIKPVITDFSVVDTAGADQMTEVLEGRVLALLIKTTDDLEDLEFKKYKELVSKVSKSQIKPIVLTSQTDAIAFLAEKKLSYPCYFVDEKVMKTMARNNPVLLLLDNGTVLGKWSFNRLPSDSKIKKLINI
jgi:uncharacterized membrane protein YphA (DoxX/SURF4 family)